MSKQNLVPKQITDKNGVSKTHWVRPDEFSGVHRTLPAPVAASNSRDEPKLKQLMEDALSALGPETWSYEDLSYRNLWFLAQHSPEKLELVLEQCAGDTNLKTLWTRRVNTNTLHPKKNDTASEREKYLTDWQIYLDVYPLGIELISLTGDHGNNPGLLREHTRALETDVSSILVWGTNMVHKDNREQPQPELVQALALICIIRGTYGEAYWRMDNARLAFDDVADDVTYISQHLEEVKPLVPTLVNRKSHDAGLIRELLDVDVKALSSGAL